MHSMQIPIEFSMPENYTSTEDLPKSIPFNIQARTGNLMTLNYRMRRSPLKIPLRNKKISSEQLAALLKERIYAKVESITTLYELPQINLDTIVEKSVELVSNNEISTKQGYSILTESITPNTIKIKGASKLIDQVDSLFLSKLVLKNLDKDFVDSVHILKNYSELIELSQDKAKIEITLDQMVQKELSFFNALVNDTLKIKLSTPSSLYEKIDSSFFRFIILDDILQVTSKDSSVNILEYSKGN